MSVTFLHIADLHLDSPFRDVHTKNKQLVSALQSACEQSLVGLIDTAIAQKVDACLIAGDSFNGSKPSVHARLFLQQALERLAQHAIPVFLIYGNHDYDAAQTLPIRFPDNVTVFADTVSTVTFTARSGESVAISGFSYQQQHITERKIATYPKKQGVDYQIGLLHGAVEAQDSHAGLYAPFSLKELNDKGYDYWALGHIHKREVLQVQPPIVYAGNPQGLNRKETGAKGGYLVTLTKGEAAQLQFIDTAPIQWAQIQLLLANMTHFNDVVDLLKTHDTLQTDVTYLLVSVTFIADSQTPQAIIEALQDDSIREALSFANIFVYRVDLQMADVPQTILLDDTIIDNWQQLQDAQHEHQVYQKAMQVVWQHTKMRTLLPDLQTDEELASAILLDMQALMNRYL